MSQFVSIWRHIGFDRVMFIGAIQSVSPGIYEAAELDGANRWQIFRYIIAPGIRPIILLQTAFIDGQVLTGFKSLFRIFFPVSVGNYRLYDGICPAAFQNDIRKGRKNGFSAGDAAPIILYVGTDIISIYIFPEIYKKILYHTKP